MVTGSLLSRCSCVANLLWWEFLKERFFRERVKESTLSTQEKKGSRSFFFYKFPPQMGCSSSRFYSSYGEERRWCWLGTSAEIVAVTPGTPTPAPAEKRDVADVAVAAAVGGNRRRRPASLGSGQRPDGGGGRCRSASLLHAVHNWSPAPKRLKINLFISLDLLAY